MEVKNTPLLFQQDVNRFYKDINNCEIVHPPYREWNVPETFFLSKRKGIGPKTNFWGDNVIDYVEFNGDEYAIVHDGTDIVVKKHWVTPVVISTQPYNANHYHSFKDNFISVAWELQDEGTITGSAETSGIFTITDSSKSWTTNEFASMYLMMTDGVGSWQIIRISSNTSTTLTMSNWWDSQPQSGTTYKIFPNYAEVLAFIGDDWIYIIHNETNVTRLTGFGSVVDACYNDGRIFAFDDSNNVLVSAMETNDWAFALSWGYFSAYANQTSLIWAISWGMRITPFNNVVLIFTNNKINIVKKLTADKSWTSFESFIVNVWTKFIWLHSPDAVYSYNTGLYLLTNKKKFVSLNVTDWYQWKYKIDTEDMGINIQQRLDNVDDGDVISVWINNEDIYIVWNRGSKTTIFKYNFYYSFWYRWETALSLSKVVIGGNETFLWETTYRYNKELVNDSWDNSFLQSLRLFNWESDVFSLKTILYNKLFLGRNTNMNTLVRYKARLSQGSYEYEIPFTNIPYLQKATALSWDWTLGTSILGYWVLWGIIEWSLVDTLIADIDVIEIPLWITYSLLEITIEWDFEIWWMIIWAQVHQPYMTPYEDVASYFN